VEWGGPSFGGASTADLTLTAYDAVHDNPVWSDTITFDPFESIVMVLGGWSQNPADPVEFEGDHGLLDLAITQYRAGYNVYMYDEDEVLTFPYGGAGVPYDVIVNAINNQGISNVAIMGYSQGGGSTYDLAWRLNENVKANPTLNDITNPFSVPFTAYIDAVKDQDLVAEDRRPLLSEFHVSQYQRYVGLRGAPSGGDDDINVSYIPGINHGNIDDQTIVLDFLKMRWEQKVPVK